MTISERKERDRLRRKKEIIDAAESVLIKKGFSAMTMDDVAAKAQFTKRTVYSYFSGKEDLYAAVKTRSLTYLNLLFEDASKTEGTGLDKIEAIGNAFIAFSQSGSREYAVLCQDQGGPTQLPDTANVNALQMEFKREMTVMGKVIGTGIADGSIRPDMNPTLTAMYLAVFSSVMIETAGGPGNQFLAQIGVTPEQFIEKGMEFFSLALTNKEYQPNK
jgi:TetR/AcrR family transcriptional regulator